ncbi:MAG: AMP-binding protein [Eubacterium sp.]|nr:AMP-binding protein [Eubacterium sp.]
MRNKPYEYYSVPEMKDLKEMINRNADQIPDNTAFIYPCETGEMKKSYLDLKNDIDAFGTWMYDKKIKDKHVAIIGENSYEWLVTYFAAIFGGSVAVAIDKNLPEDEVMDLSKIGEVDVFFVSDTYYEKLKKKTRKKMYNLKEFDDFLSEGRSLLKEGTDEFLKYELIHDKTATILFTSGTTGISKGVELTNHNIAFEIVNTSKLFEPKGGVLAVLPFHHAFGLVVGILMVINYCQPIYINKSLKFVKKNMEEFGPQTMFLVPMFVEFFHRQIWAEIAKRGKTQAFKGLMKSTDLLLKTGLDVRKKTYGTIQKVFGGNLEYIICGGAALDPMYVKEFRTWGIEILNGYGATECSPCTAVNRPLFHKDGSVGVVVPGIEVKATEEGEIAFRGELVMKGYYKNPEATAAALKDGWYHTGDLGYVDEDNFIFLTGRAKNLIILSNGENISPEELELNLQRDDAVNEALVYDENGKIVAEVFPDEKHLGDVEYFEKLKNKVNKGRPIYKQITKIKLRDEEFIKNASMKIVRHKNIPAGN